MLRFIIIILIIVAIGWAFLYLAPDTWKELARTWINDQDYIPEVVQERSDALLATPISRKKQLLNTLEDNLTLITDTLTSQESSTSDSAPPQDESAARTFTLLEESRKLIGELRGELEKVEFSNPVTALIENTLGDDTHTSVNCNPVETTE